MMPTLPTVVAVLLRALPRDLRDPIAGDLEEEYHRARSRRGAAPATAWMVWTAFRIAITFWIERATQVRGVPPLSNELRSTTNMFDSLRQDIVVSARMLRRQPGFTAVAVLALAVAIGASTAVFSIVDAVLWRPLRFPGAGRVLQLAEQRPREGRWFGVVSPADFFDWRRDSQSFSAMAAYMRAAVNLTGTGEPERVRALLTTAAFFDVVGVAPVRGRGFSAGEETFGRHRVVVLTDAFWRRRFGGDPNVLGHTVTFDGNPYAVVGILPPSFWWPTRPDAVMPLALLDADRALRAAHFLNVIGRVKDGVSGSQAHEELAVIGRRLSRQYPAENARHFPNTRPLRDALVGDVRPALIVLLGAVGFLMLIACANVATLLLARAAGRQKELAVRKAVGATRGRLARQLLTESLLVAALGGMVGLLFAAWGVAGLRAIVPARFADLPGMNDLSIDLRVLAAASGLTLVTGVLFGAAPAIAASDERTGAALNEESRGSRGSPRARRLRSTLVVAELALSFVLLIGAGLLIVSFDRLASIAPGFRTEQVITMWLSLPGAAYREHPRMVAFYDALFERVRGLPGVQAVGATTAPPFSGEDSWLDLTIENRVVDTAGPVRAHPRLVSEDYFSTLGIPLIRGRVFDDGDRAEAPRVTIINQAAARRYWPNDDPIGQRISLGGPDTWMRIVGVVGDVRHEGLDVDAEPEAYMPVRQVFDAMGATWARTVAIVVRSSADPGAVTSSLRTAVHEIDPLQPIGAVRSMEELIAESMAPHRLNSLLVSAFALIAVVLTAAGLYGVMSYLVAQRTREIGVRMALGATRRQVLAMMFRQAGVMTAIGIVSGAAGALLLTRSMTALLFGVSPADPLVYAGVAALLTAVALASVAVPSSRATRIDPLLALREP